MAKDRIRKVLVIGVHLTSSRAAPFNLSFCYKKMSRFAYNDVGANCLIKRFLPSVEMTGASREKGGGEVHCRQVKAESLIIKSVG